MWVGIMVVCFFTLKLQEKTELDIEWWKSQNIDKLIYTVKTENCKKKKKSMFNL